MATTDSQYHGTCLCRGVSYTLSGEPLNMVLCHCENCQKSTGSSFGSNVFFQKPQFSLHTGADKIKDYHDSNTDAGNTVIRSFCSDCGSTVYTTNPSNPMMENAIVIPSGMLDSDSRKKFKPQAQFFCRNRQDWVEGKLDDTPRFQGMQ